MKAHLGGSYSDVTADAGYESEENYTYFEGKTTECYITGRQLFEKLAA